MGSYYFIIFLTTILILSFLFWHNIEKFENKLVLQCGININASSNRCPADCELMYTDTDLNNNVYIYCVRDYDKVLNKKDCEKYFYDDKISGGINCPENCSKKNSVAIKGQNTVYSICDKKL